MSYQLVSADTLDAEQTHGLKTIYEGGFAEQLRAPWSEIVAERADTEDALALVRRDEPVGFALVRALADTGRVFLRYLVIDGRQRGRGIGGILWQHLTAYVRRRGFSMLIWDVEHPDEPAIEPAEREVRLRRIGFYERLGGSLLPIGEYVNPHAHESGTLWVPMRLMATSLDGGTVPTDVRGLRRLALDVYAHRYRLGDDEPVVRATLATLEEDEEEG